MRSPLDGKSIAPTGRAISKSVPQPGSGQRSRAASVSTPSLAAARRTSVTIRALHGSPHHVPASARSLQRSSSVVTRTGRSTPSNATSRSAARPNGRTDAAGRAMSRLAGDGAGLIGFTRIRIALPPFELQLERLDGDGVGVGVEIGQRGELAHPAAEQLVALGHDAALVHEQQRAILAEVLQVHPGVAAQRMDQVRPLLEFEVVRDAPLERDALVGGPARRLAVGTVVAALPVLDDLGRPLQRAHLAHPEHDAPVPDQLKLEVLVRVEAVRVDDKSLRHERLRKWKAT